MTKKMSAEWKLRERMEENCIHSTADLSAKLAERGIHLSRMQVYRLMTTPPLRLGMDLLAALCDIFTCTPNDLIEIKVSNGQLRKAAGENRSIGNDFNPLRTIIRKPHH